MTGEADTPGQRGEPGLREAARLRDEANRLRWDGSQAGFYEVYFLKWNDRPSQTAGWLRYTLLSPRKGRGPALAELWGIFFDAADARRSFALKRSLPIERLRLDPNRFRLELGEALLEDGACRGALDDPDRGHRLAWDLQLSSREGPLVHFPYEPMYRLGLPRTKVLSPHVDARFSGTLQVGERTLRLEGAPGQQSHLWGTQHALRWAWGHCNCFEEDPQAVWEGLDTQLPLGPLESPHLGMFFLRRAGRWHRFDAPWRWLRQASRWSLGRWSFAAEDEELRVVGLVEAEPGRMLGVSYQDPDGRPLWCSNTKLADIRLHLSDTRGQSLGTLTSRGACAAEFVERRVQPGVPIWI
ncbi:MAG TPA: tocopherol cyclase family protein [Myxococcota bacterium]|nr:tocopherol cyclase family protein [Myxococcota bacterium]HRY91971.1 tocopherol cyclase family protein [Myxococcota bacterium]HSA21383.1 tocopherol cyclase family protein [Myxococcota bacterium]